MINSDGSTGYSISHTKSKLSISWGSREAGDISDVLDTGHHHHQPFEAKTESTMGDRSIPSEVQVPPIVLLGESKLLDFLLQNF